MQQVDNTDYPTVNMKEWEFADNWDLMQAKVRKISASHRQITVLHIWEHLEVDTNMEIHSTFAKPVEEYVKANPAVLSPRSKDAHDSPSKFTVKRSPSGEVEGVQVRPPHDVVDPEDSMPPMGSPSPT